MSGNYGEPDWANPDTTGSGAGGQETTTDEFGSMPQPIGTESTGKDRSTMVQRLLSLLNIGLCAMMCCLGVFGLIDFRPSSADDYSEAFVAAYMILFAALLFLYELMWWKSIGPVNRSLRKNFGFLYGVRGRALYLIFIAFLTLGLEHDVRVEALRYATGITFLVVGVFHLFLWVSKPELVSNYRAPSGGFDGTAAANGDDNVL